MIIMVIVIMIRRVFLKGLEQRDHLVVYFLSSGRISRITGFIYRAELGCKIFGSEIDLAHGIARNTGAFFQGKPTYPIGDIADDGSFCVNAVEPSCGHELLDLLKLCVDCLDGLGISFRSGELNRLSVSTLRMVIIVIMMSVVVIIIVMGIVVTIIVIMMCIAVIIIVGICLAIIIMIGVIVVAYITVVCVVVVSVLRLGATLNQKQAKGQDEYPQNRL